jgi:hypothetical protein
MTARRGYGDETWRLAQVGDAPALHKAADLLLRDPADLNYEGHRARAFALAVEGRADDALAQLNDGWTDDWPFPSAYATDVARIRYLTDDYAKALDALLIATRGAERVDGAVAALAGECVRRDRKLTGRALRVTLAGGTAWQRIENAGVVLRARF